MKHAMRFVCLLACAWLLAATALAQKADAPQPPTEEQKAIVHEFDAVCGQTQDAMMLTKDDLQKLVERCDVLARQLPKLDETRRKVYTRRLEQCRGLFVYVLETKKNPAQ